MEEKKTMETDIQLTEKKEVYQVKEKKSMRGENRKIYRMSDGSERAVFYGAPIHELDVETGSYEEAKNDITADPDGKHAHGENHSFKVEFNCEKDNDELFGIESRGHKITVSSNRTKGKKSNEIRGAEARILKKGRPGKKPQDVVSFEGRNGGEAYEYSLKNNGLKENIIITERSESYRYSFNLKTTNLSYECDEKDRRIYFRDTETNELIFTIPAPYMYDADGAESENVCYEIKTAENGEIRMSVIADCGWVNSGERVFPVTIDPQIDVNQEENVVIYPWAGGTVGASGTSYVGLKENTVNRTYIVINKPELPGNPRIKKVWMKLRGYTFGAETADPLVALYRVTDNLTVGQCTPENSTDMIDYSHISGDVDDNQKHTYTFDITSVYDIFEKEDVSQITLVLKLIDESITDSCFANIYMRRTGYIPELIVDYEKNDVFADSHESDSFQIGSVGRENVDLLCGNVTLALNDFVWAGNRMPVTLRHMYNSVYAEYDYTANSEADIEEADYSLMKLGKGWKLNIMQSVIESVFQLDGTTYDGYMFLDEYGKKTYLVERTEDRCEGNCENGEYTYEDYYQSGILYEPTCRKLLCGTDVYKFDSSGRLISKTDSYGNTMSITYTLGKITSVTDGAGREFEFTYSGDYLSMITAPDGSSISYTYLAGLLIRITYADGSCLKLAYDFDSLLGSLAFANKNGRNLENCTNIYTGRNITEVRSYGAEGNELKLGKVKKYVRSFAANTVTVTETYPADSDLCETEDIVSTTVYKYDADGKQISNYGKEFTGSCHNYLSGHCFENLDAWTAESANTVDSILVHCRETDKSKFGDYVLRMQTWDKDVVANGVYQTVTLPAGTYTASAYLRLMNLSRNPSIYIRVTSSDGTILAESEHLNKKYSDYMRVSEVFTLTQSTSVTVHILMDGKGTAYADAVQLEKGECAGEYNLIENAGFENGMAPWTKTPNCRLDANTGIEQSYSRKINGNIVAHSTMFQTVPAKKSRGTKETFTLSGWAKGYGLTDYERKDCNPSVFRLRAEIKYNDTEYNETGIETYTADFSPQTEDWQFASVQFSKEKYCTIESVTVYADYDFNSSTAYFDEIKLIRDGIETGLEENDFNKDIAENTDSGNTEESEEDETNSEVFEEVRDIYGNVITGTEFREGEFGTLYSSSAYGNNGNDLTGSRDTRGNITSYNVDAYTSKTERITDRLGNITEYEYDVYGNITKAVKKNSDNTELSNISYAYNEVKNPTGITRGDGMKYAVDYDAFNNLKSIGINGKTEKLITYSYKSGSGRIKSAVYANGDVMKLTYNKLGQVISERWYSSDNSIIAFASYEYVYNAEGKLISTIDFKALKEYNYTYDMGNLSKYTEKSIVLDGDIIKSRTVDFSIVYEYEDGKLVRTNYISADGSSRTVDTEYPEKENRIVKFEAGGKTVTSRSKTDGFGRKAFDELQLGAGFVSRQFSYYGGQVTEEHIENEKLKSSPTTSLVSQIAYTDGRTISYEYDAEERITKITDTEDGVTEYTYDALGQLLTETKNGTVVNTMTYDEYGNILTKNDIVYTYGNAVWRDLLTGYCGKTITYDAQGNPLIYLGKILKWDKGRQLTAFGNITFTYNASGIRTSKTVGGTKHSYTLDGTKILKETWGDNTIIPLYSNEGDTCGIIYNGEPYYFIKNLQGDIISVTDKNGNTVAKYSYDAWGVCTIISDSSNCNIATVNPYRYRGYYYDTETKLYYIQTRYYDPAVGRFINADNLCLWDIDKSSVSTNLYTYCQNNPVCNTDYNGNSFAKIFARAMIGAMYGLLVQYVGDVIDNLVNSVIICNRLTTDIFIGHSSGYEYIESIISNAIDATLMLGNVGALIKSAIQAIIEQLISFFSGKGFNVYNFFKRFIKDVIFAVVIGKITQRIKPEKCKEFYSYIRYRYNVKGTTNYEWYWRNICEGIEFNAFLISSFIDSLNNVVESIINFIKELCVEPFIEALDSV